MFLKNYLNFISQSHLPKCPFENFQFKNFHYGDLAFIWEIVDYFVVKKAIPSGHSLLQAAEYSGHYKGGHTKVREALRDRLY